MAVAEASAVGGRILRSPRFDLSLIGGTVALAVLLGALVVRLPPLFLPVLLLDLWFLSYHHVIATFTRVAFDRQSFREHRLLVLAVPVVIAAVTVAAVELVGFWVVPTVYFYWQWFHYTRQSYGLSRIYQLKTDRFREKKDRLGNTLLYLVATLGVLHRSAQRWPRFLGLEVRLVPVPRLVVWAVAVATVAAAVLWLARELRQPRGAYQLYVISHLLIFAVGYLGIADIDVGWLVVNIWHNAQYLLLVWLYNSNRFKAGVSPGHRFLSWLSQPQRWPVYVACCLLITTVFYGSLAGLAGVFASSTVPVLLIAYQVINFHHYVVDARVWKVRRKPVREALGIVA